MKAAVYYGPHDVRVEEVPQPSAGPGEVVLRVFRCAVCGTDKRIFTHGQRNVVPPTITGHEIVAFVHQLGPGVNQDLKVGQKVISATVIGCAQCVYCKRKQYNLCDSFTALGYEHQGAFAQYIKIPAMAVAQGNVIPIPESMDLDRAALIEPLSCCLNGQEYLNAQAGDRALVFGAGPIGLMHSGIMKAKGCDPIFVADISEERLGNVSDFGLGIPVNTNGGEAVEKILAAGKGEKFDVIVTATSAKQAQADALRLLRKKGRVCFFAGVPRDDSILPLDANSVHYLELSIFGAFASNLQHYHQAVAMVGRDDLPWDRFITHRFKLDDILKAYAVVEAGQGIKAVINTE